MITEHALKRSTARGRPAFLLTVKGIADEPSDSAPDLRRSLWADEGRPHPAGRFGSDHRNRERFHALWRRDYVWRRQGDPLRHGAKQHGPARISNGRAEPGDYHRGAFERLWDR